MNASTLALYAPVNEGKPQPGTDADLYSRLDPSLRPDTETHDGPLSINERTEYHECKQTINQGIAVWRKVGDALFKVHSKKLYRNEYGTWEEFLRECCGISKGEASRLMGMSQAAAVAESVAPQTKTTGKRATAKKEKPTAPCLSKAAARALAFYEPAFQKEIWKLILDRDPHANPSAMEIDNAANELLLASVKKKEGIAIAPKDQARIATRETKKLSTAAKKRKEKDETNKDHEKLIRWVEKLSKHVERMEKSGRWPTLAGLTEKALAFENEVKLRLAKKGKKA